jgi:hypothetical protein
MNTMSRFRGADHRLDAHIIRTLLAAGMADSTLIDVDRSVRGDYIRVASVYRPFMRLNELFALITKNCPTGVWITDWRFVKRTETWLITFNVNTAYILKSEYTKYTQQVQS